MSKPRLLLADDSLTIQKLVNLTFADEGFDVVTVGDGESALREMGAVQPDIVLADVHMPGPSGYDICKLMRGVDETANIPVILLVGSFEQFDEEEADSCGANAFMTKPFQSIRTLVDEVNGLLAAAVPAEIATATDVDESVPVADVPDTSDIDSLYEKSFAETVEMPADMAAGLYSVDRLDDEMIETSYSADQEGVPSEFAVTPIGDADFDNGHQTEEFAPEPPQIEAEIEADENVVPVYDDMPSGSEGQATAATMAAIQSAPTEEFRHEPRDPFATTTQQFDLDEIDLLDLTPESMTETIEFTTPADAAAQGSKSQVVSLSPELLDIIVQRVVEKLADKY